MKRFFLLISILFSLLFVNLNAIEKTYKDKKFYDQNKNDSLNQRSACWAASTANILKAWQDYLNKFYYTSPPLGTPSTLNEIYERVYSFGYLKSQKIKAEANSTVNGISWFIAGISYDSETNSIEKSKSGGFYKDLYKGISSPADLVKMHKVVDINMSLKGLETIFENSLKKDSKISISLSSDDGGSNHAITFWGYETKNNKLSSIFITDSDDNYKGKKEYKILAANNKIYLSDYGHSYTYYIRSLIEFNILLPAKIKDRYVSAYKGDDSNSGESWQKAFKSLDAAINSIRLVATSEEDYTIHMEEGVYSVSSDILYAIGNDKSEVKIQNNIQNSSFKILGGYRKGAKSSARTGETVLVPTTKSPLSLVYVKNSKITFDSITFDAKNQTRGLYITENSTVTLNNCILRSCLADTSGAAVYCEGTLKIKNSKIYNNNSKDSGAAICAKGEVHINASVVSSNKGGGIYSQGKLMIEKSKINDNFSEKSGAGIVAMGDCSIKNSSIFRNKSTNTIGGLYVKGKLTLLNSTIAKNNAKDCGGLYISKSYAESSINYCTIAENTSSGSVNIYLQSGLHLSINNSIIWKNNMSYLSTLNAKNSLINGYKSNSQNNIYNASEYLKSDYSNALIWNDNAFYTPRIKVLLTKDKSEQKDQLGKNRDVGCVGAIEYNRSPQ